MNNKIKILNDQEIEDELKKAPGWKREGDKISKKFHFRVYLDVIDFISSLAHFSNMIDHHPDIHIYYRDVTFELTRFDAGNKLTDRDFYVAREIDRRYKEYEESLEKL